MIFFFLRLVIPSSKLRKKLSYFLLAPKIDLTRRKKHFKEIIPVSFCFNGAYTEKVRTCIRSLLEASKGQCTYHIYCVIDETVTEENKKFLKKMVAEYPKNKIDFLLENHDFDKSYLGGWHRSIYFRLMLSKLLPNSVDKIIYSDVDTVFCDSLIDVYKINMKTNLIASTHYKGGINSGFLLLNIKQIRKENLYKTWIIESQKNKYSCPDQDLLFHTTNGRRITLPLIYNFNLQHLFYEIRNYKFSYKNFVNIKKNVVMIHYIGILKPWNSKSPYSFIWKKYNH